MAWGTRDGEEQEERGEGHERWGGGGKGSRGHAVRDSIANRQARHSPGWVDGVDEGKDGGARVKLGALMSRAGLRVSARWFMEAENEGGRWCGSPPSGAVTSRRVQGATSRQALAL